MIIQVARNQNSVELDSFYDDYYTFSTDTKEARGRVALRKTWELIPESDINRISKYNPAIYARDTELQDRWSGPGHKCGGCCGCGGGGLLGSIFDPLNDLFLVLGSSLLAALFAVLLLVLLFGTITGGGRRRKRSYGESFFNIFHSIPGYHSNIARASLTVRYNISGRTAPKNRRWSFFLYNTSSSFFDTNSSSIPEVSESAEYEFAQSTD